MVLASLGISKTDRCLGPPVRIYGLRGPVAVVRQRKFVWNSQEHGRVRRKSRDFRHKKA
jgi:hypothetical protein